MAMSVNKKFWTEFIDIYHSLPSLWDTNDEGYTRREIRSVAWNKLVEKLQEVEPDANQESVKRKINTFRSNFNREVRKIRLTQKELCTEVYTPTLWYFDQLSFLLNQEKRNNGVSSIDGQYDEETTIMSTVTAKKENESMYVEPISLEDLVVTDTSSQYENSMQISNDMRDAEQNPLDAYTSNIERPQKQSIRKYISTPRTGKVEYKLESQNAPTFRPLRIKNSKLRLAKSQEPYSSQKLQNNLTSSMFTDEAAIYGQAWACGFRKLSPQQKLFAKKAIDEILILGQLKALKLNTVPINTNLMEERSDEG